MRWLWNQWQEIFGLQNCESIIESAIARVSGFYFGYELYTTVISGDLEDKYISLLSEIPQDQKK